MAERIFCLSRGEMEDAAYLWARVASHCNIAYAFVGEFEVARMRRLAMDSILRGHCLEILVSAPLEVIYGLFNGVIYSAQFSPYLTQTVVWNEQGQAEQIQLIMIYAANGVHGKHHKGVEVRFIRTGSENYPHQLLPIGGNLQQWWGFAEPNVYWDTLPNLAGSIAVPVLRPRNLLIQTALKFSFLTNVADIRGAVRDLKVFLTCTVYCYDGIPGRVFTSEEAHYLSPIISGMLRYGNETLLWTTAEELRYWQILGVNPV